MWQLPSLLLIGGAAVTANALSTSPAAAPAAGGWKDVFRLDRIRTVVPEAYVAGAVPGERYESPSRRPEFDAPIFVLPGFLSGEECDALIAAAKSQQAVGTISESYLNHRVNEELEREGTSQEALKLALEQGLSEEDLAASCPSGLRTPLPQQVLLEPAVTSAKAPALVDAWARCTEQELEEEARPQGGSIARRVADLLGLGREAILFSDKLWYNPSQSRFCFRDQTVVHYKVGEGVAPHVDGKDATILMYLNDVPEGCGGRTIFSEAGLAMPVRRGTALLYCSKGQNLLHYAERVAEGEKWVSQFLIDFKYRPGMGELKVDYETGAVIA